MIPLQLYRAPGSHVVTCAFTLVGREPWQTPLNALLASFPKHRAPATIPTSLQGAAGLSEGMGQVEFGKGQGMGRRHAIQPALLPKMEAARSAQSSPDHHPKGLCFATSPPFAAAVVILVQAEGQVLLRFQSSDCLLKSRLLSIGT